eukprot:SM000030S11444  [mRNA]  locus=s30:752389:754293:+ [translate_table: standard]
MRAAAAAARLAARAASAARRAHTQRIGGGAATAARRAHTALISRAVGSHSSGSRGADRLAPAFLLPAAVVAVWATSETVLALEQERTFIAVKPDGVQRGLVSEIIARFERKGYKLVGIKIVTPTKEFAEKHYDDLKNKPFFNGLTDFLSSGPVVGMVWEGEGVIKYGRKMIGATNPSASEPGTIRGDLAVVVGRNIIHGSDGPETAKDEISLWFKEDELVSYSLDTEKWIYEK